MRIERAFFILFLITMSLQSFAGTVYYVDSARGNDSNNGLTPTTAWKTINKANVALTAGDTVYVRGGVYNDNAIVGINPKNSGTPGNYITYQNYPGETPIIRGCGVGFFMDQQYIKIDGFTLDGISQEQSAFNRFCWFFTNHNIVQNCVMRYLAIGSNKGVEFEPSASYNQLLNCTVEYVGAPSFPVGQEAGDCIWIEGHHNLIEGCNVDYGGHSTLTGVGTSPSCYSNIIRNNIIRGHWGGTLGVSGAYNDLSARSLYDGNIIWDAQLFDSSGFPRNGVQGDGDNMIFRRNLIYDNDGTGFGIWAGVVEGFGRHARHWRVYNNVIYNSGRAGRSGYGYAVALTENTEGYVFDIIFKNNIFYGNLWDGPHYRGVTSPSDATFVSNTWNDTNPRFVNADAHDFHLQDNSPCIDGGSFLTKTRSSGSGTQLPVEDAGYFCDGLGIVEGDLIQLQSQNETARVVGIDYDNNILTLNRALIWSFGQGVSLAYSGSVPDIGAYENITANPIDAKISASPTSGQVPLTVNFTGSASGGTSPYAYSWNFGDGQSSTEQNPSHTYSAAGNYSASLTVADNSNNKNTTSLTITASPKTTPPPLAASIVASPTSGQVPLTVNFTGSASGGTPPYSYSWNFGDGQSSTAQSPSHVYSSAGNYTAALTVTDSQGAKDSKSAAIAVTSPPPSLTAAASASPTSGTAPLTVNFTGSASGGTAPYSYSWNFGDGQSSTEQNPSHTYSTAGNYSAALTVTDSNSNKDTTSLTITASPKTTPPLAASIVASPTSGQVPLTVNFTGGASGGTPPYSYSWNFGDGQSSTAQSPSHVYSSAGNYTAALTVTDSQGAKDSKSAAIAVTSPPPSLTAAASASPTSGTAPLTVNFTGSASGGTAPYFYSWNFGDGQSSTTQNPSHTYSAVGNFTVTLIVTDSVSSTASSTINIAVNTQSTHTLSISSETGAPAPGQGGTTNPSPGSHSFSSGSTVQVKSIPNTDYRFSRWTGDILEPDIFKAEPTMVIDKNKSISANFCTKCGDVNGDLNIAPSDAQRAFDIYLGKIANPTDCERENADVNNDGTKSSPKITPADAQAIFNKYLKKSELPGDCSANSRAAALIMQNLSLPNIHLILNDVTIVLGEEVTVPVILESPHEIDAFGFDLSFPPEVLQFIRLERTEYSKDFVQIDANEITPGTLRVGGYRTSAAANSSPEVLVTLIFRVIGYIKEQSSLMVVSTYDDLQNAMVRSGMLHGKVNDNERTIDSRGEKRRDD